MRPNHPSRHALSISCAAAAALLAACLAPPDEVGGESAISAQNDMQTGGDAGNSFGTATVPRVITGTGLLELGDDKDMYVVSLTAGQTILVDLTVPATADFHLTLLDPDGAVVAASSNPAGVPESIAATAGAAGDYRLKLRRMAGSGSYGLSITITAWARAFWAGTNETSYQVRQTSDGGYLLAASASIENDGLGLERPWIVKLSPAGTVTWSRQYHGGDGAIVQSAVQTSAGYAFVANENTTDGVEIVGLDPAGAIRWQYRYAVAGEVLRAFHMGTTPDGGFLVAGLMISTANERRAWLMQVAADGSLRWGRAFAAAGLKGAAYAERTNDGGYVFVSESGPTAVVRLNADLTTRWSWAYPGLMNSGAGLGHLHDTLDGGHVISGSSGGAYMGLKLRGDGTIAWQKRYTSPGNNLVASRYDFHAMPDGGYVALANMNPGPSNGCSAPQNAGIGVALLDGDGEPMLARQYIFGQILYFPSISMTPDGGFIAQARWSGCLERASYDVALLRLPADLEVASLSRDLPLVVEPLAITPAALPVTVTTPAIGVAPAALVPVDVPTWYRDLAPTLGAWTPG